MNVFQHAFVWFAAAMLLLVNPILARAVSELLRT